MLNVHNFCFREQLFEKSRQRGSKLKVSFEYTPLQVLNITNDTTEDAFQKNYVEKMYAEPQTEENSEGDWLLNQTALVLNTTRLLLIDVGHF